MERNGKEETPGFSNNSNFKIESNGNRAMPVFFHNSYVEIKKNINEREQVETPGLFLLNEISIGINEDD